MLAIYNSPKEVVQGFCQEPGFDKVYVREYEVVDKRFTSETLHL